MINKLKFYERCKKLGRFSLNKLNFYERCKKLKKFSLNKLKFYGRCKKLERFSVKRVMCVGAALVTLLTLPSCSKKEKNNSETPSQEPISISNQDTTKIRTLGTHNIWDIGLKLQVPSKDKLSAPKFGNVVSGNFDASKVVVGSDGAVYVDSAAAEAAANAVGTTTDTKGGTLDTSGDKVRQKDDAYQVRDANGDLQDFGDGTLPSGYSKDSAGNIVKNSDKGTYDYADADYYDPNTGELIFKKGDKVEDLEKAKSMLTTVKPSKSNSGSSNSSNSSSSSSGSSSSAEKSTNSCIPEGPDEYTKSETASSSDSSASENEPNTPAGYYTAPDGSFWSSRKAYEEYLKYSSGSTDNTTSNDGEELYEVDGGQTMTKAEFEAYKKTLTR